MNCQPFMNNVNSSTLLFFRSMTVENVTHFRLRRFTKSLCALHTFSHTTRCTRVEHIFWFRKPVIAYYVTNFMPQIKQMNRQSELLLHDAELLAALAFIVGDKNPGKFLFLSIFKLSTHEHEVLTIYTMHFKPINSISTFGYPFELLSPSAGPA